MRLLRVCGSEELGQVAYCFAMQGFRVETEKVKSQVVGKDKADSLGKE